MAASTPTTPSDIAEKTAGQEPTQRGVSYLYMLAAFVIVTAGIRMAQDILQLLLMSVFIAVVGVPIYAWLVEKRKIASWLSLLIVISGLFCSTLIVFWIVMTSLADFTSQQDHYVEQLRERTRPLELFFQKLMPEQQPVISEPDEKNITDSESGTVPVRDPEPTVQQVNSSLNEQKQLNAQQLKNRVEDSPKAGDVVGALPSDNDPGKQETPDPGRETASGIEGRAEIETVFESEPQASAGWLQPRKVIVPPQSRRSWRELIASQFDPGRVISLAASLALSVSQILSNTTLILLTVVFILLEASTFPRKLSRAFGDHADIQDRYRLIIDRIRSYLMIKTAMSLLTGILIAVWLWLFGVPYAGLWGMLAFLLNYIPNIGSIIAAVPALLVAWLDLGLMVSAAAAIGYVVVNMGVGNILEPKVLGRGMGLSALVVFCSMVFWGWALGPVGMLLSVPLTMAARVALEGFDDTRWLGTLLGDAD
jgi:predicted PurR-regulated permease PerM